MDGRAMVSSPVMMARRMFLYITPLSKDRKVSATWLKVNESSLTLSRGRKARPPSPCAQYRHLPSTVLWCMPNEVSVCWPHSVSWPMSPPPVNAIGLLGSAECYLIAPEGAVGETCSVASLFARKACGEHHTDPRSIGDTSTRMILGERAPGNEANQGPMSWCRHSKNSLLPLQSVV